MTPVWLAAPVFALLAAVALHAAAGRVSVIANSVVRFVAIGSAVGAILLLVLAAHDGLVSARLATGLLIYGFACALYIFLFTFTLSSVSANLLYRLARRPLAAEEVAKLYSGDRMTAARIERMIGAGLLVPGPGGVALSPAGARIVRNYDILRRLFRHVDEAP